MAVVGATGAVGIEMIKTLEKRNFPARRVAGQPFRRCILAPQIGVVFTQIGVYSTQYG